MNQSELTDQRAMSEGVPAWKKELVERRRKRCVTLVSGDGTVRLTVTAPFISQGVVRPPQQVNNTSNMTFPHSSNEIRCNGSERPSEANQSVILNKCQIKENHALIGKPTAKDKPAVNVKLKVNDEDWFGEPYEEENDVKWREGLVNSRKSEYLRRLETTYLSSNANSREKVSAAMGKLRKRLEPLSPVLNKPPPNHIQTTPSDTTITNHRTSAEQSKSTPNLVQTRIQKFEVNCTRLTYRRKTIESL